MSPLLIKLLICALLVTQTLSNFDGKLNRNFAEKTEKSDSDPIDGNAEGDVLQKSLTREARSILPIILFGIKHPMFTKAMVTIGKITLPLLAYYLNIVLIQTVMDKQGNGDYLQDELAKYKIPQSTRDIRYMYTYNVTYEDGAYKLYNSTIYPIDNAYDMLFRKFEKIGKIINIDIKYHRIPVSRRYPTTATGQIVVTTTPTSRMSSIVTNNPRINQNKPTYVNQKTNINENNNVHDNQKPILTPVKNPPRLSHDFRKYQEIPLAQKEHAKAHIENHQDIDNSHKKKDSYIKENEQKQQNKPFVIEEYHGNARNPKGEQNAQINLPLKNIDINNKGNKIEVLKTPVKNDGNAAISNYTPLKKTDINTESNTKIKNALNTPSEINLAGVFPPKPTNRPTMEKKPPTKHKTLSNVRNDRMNQQISEQANSLTYNTGYDRYGFPVSNFNKN